MSELTMEIIEQTLKDYPYWVLAKTLAKNLSSQSLIEYPVFLQQNRYKELDWKNLLYESGSHCYDPLTPAEKEEYEELRKIHNHYSSQLDELHRKTMITLKALMTTFGIIPPENINPKLLTMDEKTIEAWKGLSQSLHRNPKVMK